MKIHPSSKIASVLATSMLLASVGANAQTRAVETTNFAIGIESTDSDTSDSTSSGTLGAKLVATLPIGSYFGTSLSGRYAESKVRTRDVLGGTAMTGVRPSCSYDNMNGEATLFVRRPSLGKIAVSYGAGELSADCGIESIFIPSGEDSLDVEGYRVDMEFYLGDFTLAAARTSTDLEEGVKLESNSVTASWYPLDSLRISASGNDLYDEDTYGVLIEHQPEFLGDGFGVELGYSRTEQSTNTRTFTLGLTYYFGTNVPLKVRDRQYR